MATTTICVDAGVIVQQLRKHWDVDTKRWRVGDDEINDELLVEAGGVIMRANIIVVEGDQEIASASMPMVLSSTTTSVSDATER